MDKLEQVLINFFRHQIYMKMFHFQTKSYGAHKASDAYLAKFNINFDQFMEVAQGKYGQFNLQNMSFATFNFGDYNDATMTQGLKQFSDNLRGYKSDFGNDADLNAILDIVIADAEQLRYLLTFK